MLSRAAVAFVQLRNRVLEYAHGVKVDVAAVRASKRKRCDPARDRFVDVLSPNKITVDCYGGQMDQEIAEASKREPAICTAHQTRRNRPPARQGVGDSLKINILLPGLPLQYARQPKSPRLRLLGRLQYPSKRLSRADGVNDQYDGEHDQHGGEHVQRARRPVRRGLE